VAQEDALTYQEPPDWYHPVRQTLGAIQVEAGKFPEAEKTFRDDLKAYWNNGWSLYGLAQALEKQGKGKEAVEVRKAFSKAFAQADVTLTSSRK
jgi:predicted Zn-dependent protease